MSEKVIQFISSHWDDCIKENMKDNGTLIGLPYPYTVPAVGHFDEMYYWDTYFTNKGLEIEGRFAQAKNNTDNMLYLVNRFGYMPNGNRTYYLKNSQPPFLSIMVGDVYRHYNDKAWLTGAFETLKKEYNFWMTRRMTPIGLNMYDGYLAPGADKELADSFKMRTGFMPNESIYNVGRHHLITCESGWDINPRWDTKGYDFAPVDLNSLMFMFEKNMEYFSCELGKGEDEIWAQRAQKRCTLMKKYMETESGLFLDYNFKDNNHSRIFSAASFYILFAGLAERKNAEALVENINRLETEYGLLACEKNNTEGTYQWDYPNGWACLHYIAISGLDKYGYKKEAAEIAQKYIALVDKVFEETGNLWEKYNVVEGNLNVNHESKKRMPAMMGWSAGVYLAALEYIEKRGCCCD